jgi:hypothetical protein
LDEIDHTNAFRESPGMALCFPCGLVIAGHNAPTVDHFSVDRTSNPYKLPLALLTPRGLFVVASLAKRLPVISIPKQILVASVRYDVIDHCSKPLAPVLVASLAHRKAFQVKLRFTLPSSRIASLVRGTAKLIV